MSRFLTKEILDSLTYRIIGATIDVHKELGPGLLESVYEKCLAREFQLRNIFYKKQLLVPVFYRGASIDAELRLDFLVEEIVAVEIKAVDAIAPIHEAQLLTYMKLLNIPKGVLINFNCVNIFKEGQRTMVNELYRDLPEK